MKRVWHLIGLTSILLLVTLFIAPLLLTPHPVSARSLSAPLNLLPLSPHISQAKPALSLPEANIAFFDDPAYVDTAGQFDSESDSLQATLTYLSHTAVTTFTGITENDFSTALNGKDILIIPELEKGDLGTDLSAAARGVISDFVANGGGLIIHGSHNETTQPNNESYVPNFLNNVFGFVVESKGSLPNEDEPDQNIDSNIHKLAVVNTAFFDNVNDLKIFDATQFLVSNSLPPESKTIYITPFGDDTSVALMPFGAGQIIFMGWDWVFAAPAGTRDAGWLAVLDSAIHQLMPPNLSLVKTVSASQVQPGQPITYTITFSNAGGVGGGLLPTDIVLTDVVPVSVTGVIIANSGVTITPTGSLSYVWQVADLNPWQGGVITISGLVNGDLPDGAIFTNTATITGINENDPGNNQSQATVIVTDQIIIELSNSLYLPLAVRN